MLSVDLLIAAVETLDDGVVVVDGRSRELPVIYINQGFQRMTGYSAAEARGRNCRFLRGGDADQPDLAVLRAALQAGESCTVRLRNFRKDGTPFWNELRVTPVRDGSGELTHWVGIQRDISELVAMKRELVAERRQIKDMHRRLRRLAMVDPVTGVANRAHFDEQMAAIWRRSAEQGSEISLWLVDVDHFDGFVELYGRLSADGALRKVADALSCSFREYPDLVARFSDSAFVIIAPGMGLRQALERSLMLRTRMHELKIPHEGASGGLLTVSGGIAATTPGLPVTVESALVAADEALRQARDDGHDRMVVCKAQPGAASSAA